MKPQFGSKINYILKLDWWLEQTGHILITTDSNKILLFKLEY